MSGSNLFTGTLDILILRTLAATPLHGYAIGRTIREGSAGVLSVEEGALYPALHRLEEIDRGEVTRPQSDPGLGDGQVGEIRHVPSRIFGTRK